MHRETIRNHLVALLSILVGPWETVALWFSGEACLRLNEADAFFADDGMLLEQSVVMLRIVCAVMRSAAFQPGQRGPRNQQRCRMNISCLAVAP